MVSHAPGRRTGAAALQSILMLAGATVVMVGGQSLFVGDGGVIQKVNQTVTRLFSANGSASSPELATSTDSLEITPEKMLSHPSNPPKKQQETALEAALLSRPRTSSTRQNGATYLAQQAGDSPTNAIFSSMML